MRRFLMAVDNFYPDPDRLRAEALRLPYAEPPDYVGWRTRPVRPRGVRRRIEQAIRLPITRWVNEADDFELGDGVFYIGLSRGERAERVGVHYDEPAGWVTMVVYLTPGAPADAGTSLWRHRPTGLTTRPTRRDAERLGVSVAELNDALDGDSRRRSRWEEIDRVGNVYNRAVFYHSGMLHSATRHFGRSVRDGRVYQTFRFAVDWRSGGSHKKVRAA